MGSSDAARETFNKGLVENGSGWMEMIHSCNQTSYTYNQKTVDVIVERILNLYFQLFEAFLHRMSDLTG